MTEQRARLFSTLLAQYALDSVTAVKKSYGSCFVAGFRPNNRISHKNL
jgi:hypothetical protein